MSTTNPGALVDVITTSEVASRAGTSARLTAVDSTCSASSMPCSTVLFATAPIVPPRERRFRAVNSLIFPAPIRRTVRPREIAEHLLGECGGRGRNRRWVLTDRRLDSRATAGVQRLTEEAVEQGAGRAAVERVAHLAEDLPLPGNERVEPGRDPEEVQCRAVVPEAVEQGRERVGVVRARAREATRLRAPRDGS